MTLNELLKALTEGDNPSFPFPMPPPDGVALVIRELLPDLSEERKAVIQQVIEEWVSDYANACASSAMEGVRE